MEEQSIRSTFDLRPAPKVLIWAGLAALFLSAAPFAMNKVPYTALEYDSWPDICKGHMFTMPAVPGQEVPKLSKEQTQRRWKVGGWHYCHGLLWVRRAELARGTPNAKRWAKYGVGEINYSLTRIDINDPWAAEMLVTRARALRVLNERDKAKEDILKALKHHADYAAAYLAMAQLYFDGKDYESALAVLKKGNAATDSKDAELQYFLGLAYFYVGNIEKAQEYEKKASAMGYRLRGLSRKIKRHMAEDSKN